MSARRPAAGLRGIASALLLAWHPVAAGAETVHAETGESTVVESQRRAAAWDLSADDWIRYEELMRGRRGTWTPGADPLLVLGAHARTESERRRFAEAFVLAEHERVAGELAFERAVQAAWARLFPGRLRIAMATVPPAERYALVVDRDCVGCGRTLRGYLKGSAPVDVYVRGAADDADLRAWAAAQGIEAAHVLGGLVTVNHGDASVPGEAPAAWVRRGGRWSPVGADSRTPAAELPE